MSLQTLLARAGLAAMAGGLAGACTLIVTIERPGCASDRTLTVTRQGGHPTQRIVQARRVCGVVPPDPDPIGTLLLRRPIG